MYMRSGTSSRQSTGAADAVEKGAGGDDPEDGKCSVAERSRRRGMQQLEVDEVECLDGVSLLDDTRDAVSGD